MRCPRPWLTMVLVPLGISAGCNCPPPSLEPCYADPCIAGPTFEAVPVRGPATFILGDFESLECEPSGDPQSDGRQAYVCTEGVDYVLDQAVGIVEVNQELPDRSLTATLAYHSPEVVADVVHHSMIPADADRYYEWSWDSDGKIQRRLEDVSSPPPSDAVPGDPDLHRKWEYFYAYDQLDRLQVVTMFLNDENGGDVTYTYEGDDDTPASESWPQGDGADPIEHAIRSDCCRQEC